VAERLLRCAAYEERGIGMDVPDTAPDPDPNRAPDLVHAAMQLVEARAAARTLYELYPDPATVEPLYRALERALAEVAEGVSAYAARLPQSARGGGPFRL
jgi:hypothetical protein